MRYQEDLDISCPRVKHESQIDTQSKDIDNHGYVGRQDYSLTLILAVDCKVVSDNFINGPYHRNANQLNHIPKVF